MRVQFVKMEVAAAAIYVWMIILRETYTLIGVAMHMLPNGEETTQCLMS